MAKMKELQTRETQETKARERAMNGRAVRRLGPAAFGYPAEPDPSADTVLTDLSDWFDQPESEAK
jgi:hypothetical protein